MKKRVQIAFGVLFLTVFGFVAWQVLVTREEPIINGQPLRFWLENYTFVSAEFDRAVQKAGTNAIPTLLRMLKQRDSPLKVRAMALAQQQDFVKIPFFPDKEQNAKGYQAFLKLGVAAKSAVPRLIEIYESQISDESQGWTARSLGAVGPEAKQAVPALLRGVTNSSVRVRTQTIVALSFIRSDMGAVVPALTECLNAPNTLVRLSACTALANLGTDAKAGVPTLAKLLNDPNHDVRAGAANAIISIDPAFLEQIAPNALMGVQAEAAARRAFIIKYEMYRSAPTNTLKATDPEAAARAGVK
jgi:hypothetical protein